MPQKTGTHDVAGTLAARLSAIPDFSSQNLDRITGLVNDELAAHNAVVGLMIDELAEPSDQRIGVYGSVQGGSMVEVDEYGRGPTQKEVPGESFGIPLRKFQYPIGWTANWFLVKKPQDLAVAITASEVAHKQRIRYEIQRALLLSANYTYTDHLVDNFALAVKRLVNADSASIPVGPNGELYDGTTHTHYNGYASLTAPNMLDNITDVAEHAGQGGDVRVYIATADETAVRALTPTFQPYLDPRLQLGIQSNQVNAPRLDITKTTNRAIGIFGPAEVWVKSWMPANYQFAFSMAGGKPLRFRQRPEGILQGLRIAAENMAHPLTARFMEADYGFGVFTRTNGAVGYFANATYADPTLVEP